MLTKNINFRNFKKEKINKKIIRNFENLVNEKNEILKSLGEDYKDSFKKKKIIKI